MNTRTHNSIHIESTEDALHEVLNLFNADDSHNQAGCDEDDDNDHEHEDDEGKDEDEEDDGNTGNCDRDGHFERISKMYIKDGTRMGYSNSNRLLLLWLDKNHPECVSENAKSALQQTYELQHQTSTPKHENKAVTEKAMELIMSANSIESSPIILSTISSRLFVDFLHCRAQLRGNEFLSKSGCGGFRSAFRELHRQCGTHIDPALEEELKQKFKGLLRGHAEEKQEKGGRLAEGKDPMSFPLYTFLCKKMVQDGSKEAVFAHAFLTLTWNLICRSKNTVHIHMNHMTCGSDSIIIKFAHTKTDVTGDQQAFARHVYANPYNLDICAMTALAKYLSCFPPKEDGLLFDVKSYKRFQKYLKKMVKTNKAEVERMGFDIADIGVHSIRKGAATYCCCGTTSAPQIAAICNRAGWTMGKVKDVYIKYGAAGDQHVGRVVAGLPVLDAKYACSPPFFCTRQDDTVKCEANECTPEDIDYAIATFFPNFQAKITFKPVAISCTAALFYAHDYFEKNVVSNACFRNSSALFKLDRDERLMQLKKATTIVHAWDENSKYYNVSNLTGIPAHIVTYVNQQKLSEKIDHKFQEYASFVTRELDKRQMGGGSLTFELIEERINTPLLSQLSPLISKISSLEAAINNKKEGPASLFDDDVEMPEFRWQSDTKRIPRLLPENYVVPTSIHPLAIWQQWHHGASFKDGIAVGPLKNVEPLNCPKKYQRRFQLMRRFCKELDSTSGVKGSESMAELGVLFKNNTVKWQDLGILLPSSTPTNRSRTRDENGWHYIAQNWEKLLALRKRASESGISVEELLKADKEKERLRQKRYRDAAKARKHAAADDGHCREEDDGRGKNPRQAQRPRRNVAAELGVSGQLALRIDTLIN